MLEEQDSNALSANGLNGGRNGSCQTINTVKLSVLFYPFFYHKKYE